MKSELEEASGVTVPVPDVLPALRRDLLRPLDATVLAPRARAQHVPRILLLYGSLRAQSYSRLLTEEAARLLEVLGAEPRIFDPRELPVAGSVGPDHPAMQELRSLSLWSEGQVWCSPEMHGAVTGVFKNQIDWLPLELGATRPTPGTRARGHAGVGRVAELQRGEHVASAWPLDADVHHPESVQRAKGI